MQIDYRLYPHPVLSYFSDDLVDCAFQTNLQTAVSKTAFKFAIVSKTSSKSLLELLQKKKAQHALHVECPSTRYRHLFTSLDTAYEAVIPSEHLDGRVQLCAFILAAEDLQAYKNVNFHPDYGGRSFVVKKGDVLAVDRDRYFVAEKETDPLRSIPSIFTIERDSNENADPFDLDVGGQKVVIKLSSENFDHYKTVSIDQDMRSTLCSLVVFPALVSVLEMINPSNGVQQHIDYEERRWYRVLKKRLHELGYDIAAVAGWSDSAITIAQKAIGQPLTSSLNSIVAYLEDGGEAEVK